MTRWLFVCVFTCALSHAVSAAQPQFMYFRDLPEGFTSLHIDAVSANGRAVVGHGRVDQGTRAFRWTSATGFDVFEDSPFGTPSFARDVSANGKVVVGSLTGENGDRPFIWTPRGGVQVLPEIARGSAIGISDDGRVIAGTMATPTGGRAYRWTKSSRLELLGDPDVPYLSNEAFNISANGHVIVGAMHGDGRDEAFRWSTASGFQLLGDLPGGRFGSEGLDASADGSVVVGVASGDKPEPFRWAEATGMQTLAIEPVRGGSLGIASGITDDGALIVGNNGLNGAFIWDETRGLRNLRRELIDRYGLELEMSYFIPGMATAITGDGETIVGIGALGGVTTGWIATVPEPSAIVLAALGFIALILWHGKRA